MDALTPEQRAQATANIVRFMSERDAQEPEELGVVVDSRMTGADALVNAHDTQDATVRAVNSESLPRYPVPTVAPVLQHTSLLPYQARVVAELAELDVKREALRGWMRSEAFGAFAERLDQKLQLHYMDAYAACLGRRISRFGGRMP